MVHVISLLGRKSAQLTEVSPAIMAKALLLEILGEADAAGQIR